MSEKFSGAVRIVDLNDYIAPSQACVVNLKGQKDVEKTSQPSVVGEVQLQRRPAPKPQGFSQTKAAGIDEAVKVSLHDCLACSGCITSAETVMLEQQSAGEFLAQLADPQQAVVVSLSPQSRASLASAYGLTPLQAFRKLTHWLKSLGVRAVLDTSCSRDLSLLESCHEFVARYREAYPGLTPGAAAPPDAQAQAQAQEDEGMEAASLVVGPAKRASTVAPGDAAGNGHLSTAPGTARLGKRAASEGGGEGEHAKGRNGERPPGQPVEEEASTSGSSGPLPMLASACPGWICYAEKTHGAYILPHISSTKSPQQVMGAIVKRHMCHSLGLRPEQVKHVTIMPCYDKKLEASRDDFIFALKPPSAAAAAAAACSDENGDDYDEHDRGRTVSPSGGANGNGDNGGGQLPNVTEVDCVLTSSEIYELLQKQEVDFAALPEAPLDKLIDDVDERGHLFGVRGGSGGYAECIFRHAARVLFGRRVGDDGPLEFTTLRNSDFKEVSLEIGGKKVLNFACAYGFRNIQNLVRKVKTGRSEYHFVEIMACPGGCLNGGGQIKARKGQTPKEHLQSLETLYLQEVGVRDPGENPVAQALYRDWLEEPYSSKAKEVLHTRYHEREKSVSSLISNW